MQTKKYSILNSQYSILNEEPIAQYLERRATNSSVLNYLRTELNIGLGRMFTNPQTAVISTEPVETLKLHDLTAQGEISRP